MYVNDPNQLEVAKKAAEVFGAQLGRPVTSEMLCPAPQFYHAEAYHQQYLAKPGARKYCSAQPQGVDLDMALEDYGNFPPLLGPEYWKKYAPSPHCVLKESDAPFKWP